MAASDQGGHSRIWRQVGGSSGTTAEIFASGANLNLQGGSSFTASGQVTFGISSTFTLNGLLNASQGAIALPGALRRGYIPLKVIGVKTTATASGIVTAWTTAVNPKLTNPDITSGYVGYEWTTAAGNVNPLYFAPVRVPDDLATDGGLSVHVVASGAAANATNALTVMMRAGTATAAIQTTHVLAAAPVETTALVASGSVPATGFMSFSAFPENAHASGNIRLLSAGLSYRRRSS